MLGFSRISSILQNLNCESRTQNPLDDCIWQVPHLTFLPITYCQKQCYIYKRLRSLIHALFGLTVTFFIDPSKIFFTSQNTTRIQWIVGMHEMPTLRTQDSVLSRLFSWCWKRKKSWIEFNVFEWKICIWMEFLEYSRLERISNSILNQIITE